MFKPALRILGKRMPLPVGVAVGRPLGALGRPLAGLGRPLARRLRPLPKARLLTRHDRWESRPDLSLLGSDSLRVMRAESREDLAAAQRLRYEVFYEELGAQPTRLMQRLRRDFDRFDPYCEHLLVVDDSGGDRKVVGTYRILRQERAERFRRGLYTETEYDLTGLRLSGGRIMEVSRSCVLAPYRSRAAINLLWSGLAAYVFHYHVDYLVGVSSFDGTDLSRHADQLAYLRQHHRAPLSIRPKALPPGAVPLPDRTLTEAQGRAALRGLPPLLKGYLRLGAVIGEGAYVDHQFNTIDVCTIVDLRQTNARYLDHYRRATRPGQ